MSLENILIMVFIAVATNILLTFKEFCKNVDYIRHRLGHDEELSGSWSGQYHLDCEDLGLTLGCTLNLSVKFGQAQGYLKGKSTILICGYVGWFKRKTVFHTCSFREGRLIYTSDFTLTREKSGVLVIEGLDIDNSPKRIVLAKISPSIPVAD